jgi:hypothetical protein
MKCQLCDQEADPERKLCLRHLIQRRKYTADHRAKQIAANKCTVCSGQPLVTKHYCATCRILYQKPHVSAPCAVCNKSDHTQKDHKLLGICWYCPQKCLLGSNLCKDHHAERRERERLAAKDLRDRWRKEGLCLICGKSAVNLSRCEKHRKYAAKWEHEKRVRPV